ncbi:hypothetical protein FQB35_10845 [Crassaminicella thermophila]|uniref:Uncharacterized protein n=1 Tax=Crassaminicella thermophila TaxID=2599308 RepID=A0A5C0SDY8_CRATE|nr:hypothetical protein [Crassaminicella thermophila]QEK12785.1 hypothetical protein FQB35_10845 [Crassaminicella thermophila]
MKKAYFPRMLNGFILTDEQIKQFDGFMKKYRNKPDRYIFREIAKVKNEVSEEVLQQHIKNLDLLEQMEGFVQDQNKERIKTVRKILTTNTASFNQKQQSAPATQFVSGASLLLWFLILVAIWPRSYYRY